MRGGETICLLRQRAHEIHPPKSTQVLFATATLKASSPLIRRNSAVLEEGEVRVGGKFNT